MHELASRSGHTGYVGYAILHKAWINQLWNRWDEVERWCLLYDSMENRYGLVHPRRRWIVAWHAMAAAIRGDLDEARRRSVN
jgi:hypothetical protein